MQIRAIQSNDPEEILTAVRNVDGQTLTEHGFIAYDVDGPDAGSVLVGLDSIFGVDVRQCLVTDEGELFHKCGAVHQAGGILDGEIGLVQIFGYRSEALVTGTFANGAAAIIASASFEAAVAAANPPTSVANVLAMVGWCNEANASGSGSIAFSVKCLGNC